MQLNEDTEKPVSELKSDLNVNPEFEDDKTKEKPKVSNFCEVVKKAKMYLPLSAISQEESN